MASFVALGALLAVVVTQGNAALTEHPNCFTKVNCENGPMMEEFGDCFDSLQPGQLKKFYDFMNKYYIPNLPDNLQDVQGFYCNADNKLYLYKTMLKALASYKKEICPKGSTSKVCCSEEEIKKTCSDKSISKECCSEKKAEKCVTDLLKNNYPDDDCPT